VINQSRTVSWTRTDLDRVLDRDPDPDLNLNDLNLDLDLDL
jgi:hypothetical protein